MEAQETRIYGKFKKSSGKGNERPYGGKRIYWDWKSEKTDCPKNEKRGCPERGQPRKC